MNASDLAPLDPATRGLWRDNAALVQLLGLSPLLAMSTTTVTALALGLCLSITMLAATLCASLLRPLLTPLWRVPVFTVLLAGFVTVIELLLGAYAFPLAQRLGIFLPLLASCSLLLVNAERASITAPASALRQALCSSAGYLLVFALMGLIRELLGTGRLFADMGQLLPFASHWELRWFDTPPFALAGEPAGAFLLLGGLIAVKNLLDLRASQRHPPPPPPPPGSKRVRITGQL